MEYENSYEGMHVSSWVCSLGLVQIVGIGQPPNTFFFDQPISPSQSHDVSVKMLAWQRESNDYYERRGKWA